MPEEGNTGETLKAKLARIKAAGKLSTSEVKVTITPEEAAKTIRESGLMKQVGQEDIEAAMGGAKPSEEKPASEENH